MRDVNQAVEHGVSNGRIADVLVPMRYRQLTGDHSGGAAVPVVDDLQQVAPLFGGEWRDAPVIQDQHLYAGSVSAHANRYSLGSEAQGGSIRRPSRCS